MSKVVKIKTIKKVQLDYAHGTMALHENYEVGINHVTEIAFSEAGLLIQKERSSILFPAYNMSKIVWEC